MLEVTGAPAWAFTNPIFVDVDENGFEALYSDQWDFNRPSIESWSTVGTSKNVAANVPKNVVAGVSGGQKNSLVIPQWRLDLTIMIYGIVVILLTFDKIVFRFESCQSG